MHKFTKQNIYEFITGSPFVNVDVSTFNMVETFVAEVMIENMTVYEYATPAEMVWFNAPAKFLEYLNEDEKRTNEFYQLCLKYYEDDDK